MPEYMRFEPGEKFAKKNADVEDFMDYHLSREVFTKEEMEKLENRIESLEEDIGDKIGEIDRLEDDIFDLDEILDIKEDQITQLEEAVTKLKKKIEELEQASEEVGEELLALTEDYNLELRQNVYLLNENSVLKADLRQLRRED